MSGFWCDMAPGKHTWQPATCVTPKTRFQDTQTDGSYRHPHGAGGAGRTASPGCELQANSPTVTATSSTRPSAACGSAVVAHALTITTASSPRAPGACGSAGGLAGDAAGPAKELQGYFPTMAASSSTRASAYGSAAPVIAAFCMAASSSTRASAFGSASSNPPPLEVVTVGNGVAS